MKTSPAFVPLLPLDINLPLTTPPSRLALRTHSQSEPATIVHPVLTAVIPSPAPPPAKSVRLERTTKNQPTLASLALSESSLQPPLTPRAHYQLDPLCLYPYPLLPVFYLLLLLLNAASSLPSILLDCPLPPLLKHLENSHSHNNTKSNQFILQMLLPF